MVPALKYIVKISNSNLLRNPNGLLAKMQVDLKNISCLGIARAEFGKFRTMHLLFFYFSSIVSIGKNLVGLVDLVNFGCVSSKFFHLAKQDKRYKKIGQHLKVLLILIDYMI